MSDEQEPVEQVDGVEDIDVEYEVVETVDVGPVPDDEDELPDELDVDFAEVPAEEDAGE